MIKNITENNKKVRPNSGVMELLHRDFAECFYIDPPYNTGSDGFVYNDKFKFTKEELSEKLNIAEEIAERILGFNDGSTCSKIFNDYRKEAC